MSSIRRVVAVFGGATPLRRAERRGLALCFLPSGARLGTERIDDFADLDPELTVPTVIGLGKVLRILRAARLARPQPPQALVGAESHAAELLQPARGTSLRLAVRPRTRMRFVAWTESGVETVDDVIEILESPVSYVVMRRKGRFPVRVPREAVVRKHLETDLWYEVLDIDRA